MSAASLERTADWWESFIIHTRSLPWPPPSETMQSHTRSHTDKPMHALCILPAYDISYDVTSMVGRRLSYSDSPKSHNTTALHESPWPHPTPPHHSSLSFLPWHQPGSLHKLHLYRTISCSVAPRGLCLLLKADRLDPVYLRFYNLIIRSRMENTWVNGV